MSESIKWQARHGLDGAGDLPSTAIVTIDLGGDAARYGHQIGVRIVRGGDGTVGIELQAWHGPLRIQPLGSNRLFLTTQRPDQKA